MKKLLCVICCIGAFALAGCSSDDTPEAFGKKYIEKKFANINCDLLDLDYTIEADGEDAATVVIEGKIKYKEEVYLVRKDDAWVVGKKPVKKADAAEKEKTPAKKVAPVKEKQEEKAASAHH